MEISLWPQEKIPYFLPGEDTPNRMTAYWSDSVCPAPAILIFPGGAFTHRAAHEGETIARFYQRNGIHAFVVDYRLLPHRFPAMLADVQRAIRIVRSRAEEWNVDSERIFVIGFSAGGHLAACTATLEDVAKIGDTLDSVSVRPTGAILSYASTTAFPLAGVAHSCWESLVENGNRKELENVSPILHVTAETSPCFIWQTAEDRAVPVEHALNFAAELAKNGIPYEMHIYPKGPHGLGLAQDVPDVSGWAPMSINWILRNFPGKE